MAQISIRVGDRGYVLNCRDGEEDHLLRLAALIDRKCIEATATLGVMPEPRLLLTAALLIADELSEVRDGTAASAAAVEDEQLDAIASRIETLCTVLEQRALPRSDKHTYELQSLKSISYAAFCMK